MLNHTVIIELALAAFCGHSLLGCAIEQCCADQHENRMMRKLFNKIRMALH